MAERKKRLITESWGKLPLRRFARLTPVTYGDSFPPGGSLSVPSLPLEEGCSARKTVLWTVFSKAGPVRPPSVPR